MERPNRHECPGQIPPDHSAHLWETDLLAPHRHLVTPINKLDCAILPIRHLLSSKDGVDSLSQAF